ncbi:hypothetical protein Tco_0601586, partial [Tanacetum coccineum]
HQPVEPLVESQGEQLADPKVANNESAPPTSVDKKNKGKELVVHSSVEKQSDGTILVEDDSDEYDKQPLSKRFKIMSSIPDIPNPTPLNTFFLLTPPREPTPLIDSSKGKAIAIIEEPGNELVQYQEEGGSDPKMPKLKSFITLEGPLSQEEYSNQIKEMKRLNDLKAKQEKSEQELRKLFNPATLNANRLGLPPSPELATFGLTTEEKKRKRAEVIKEFFVTKDVRVNGMESNLIPPPGIMPNQGLVINEPESEIFFMNGNIDIGFQRESEFHVTPTTELIRFQRQIKVESEIAREMLSVEEPLSAGFRGEEDQLSAKHQLAVKGLSECKAPKSNIRRIQVKDIVKKVEDYLKTYSSAGMDIS